ncbi:3-oxoacyl-[acyl-carrier-protein] reductase [Pedosphaera parvula]|uniref:3-oxoacyl-[acyl-carrier-protein] reductase n=1 Tax=Pedosphaera parvula (strain Ellin514) TaxID=320771 RepID=B9XLM5_PEDPL|nr:3-oxoacyl-[acyl-carrier-protein] reductase [Pedosphaera parvula]EEF59273.1 3-oxoacyl-(acyl-carrier-protein) reductase [Pedosphaera parvula Ellin514]
MKQLQGKVCLVTGGTRGIGRAIALSMAEAGADIAFNYERSSEKAEEICHEVTALGVRCRAFAVNVTSVEEVNRMVQEVNDSLGPISIVINNAGITRDRTFLKMTKEQWDEVMHVNLDGVFNVTHAALPFMINLGWGRIINISSFVGLTGNFGQTNYAVTKGGINSFTMALARETARKGITVNSVAPGFIATDMTKEVPPSVLDQVRAMTPVGRLGNPEEVADAVAFLASPRAGYITGQVLSVNGGIYM